MFCPSCGKQINEDDKFCRHCGNHLEPIPQTTPDTIEESSEEEYVLYEIKKHWRSLVIPAFLLPLFFFYFWNIFLNTHSLFSWVVVFAILGLIIYPIARYKSDRIIVTTQFAHIKIGVLNPEEKAIALKDFVENFEITQSSMGRFLDYGRLTVLSNGESIDYGYIVEPEEFQYIIDNPIGFAKESMEETYSKC